MNMNPLNNISYMNIKLLGDGLLTFTLTTLSDCVLHKMIQTSQESNHWSHKWQTSALPPEPRLPSWFEKFCSNYLKRSFCSNEEVTSFHSFLPCDKLKETSTHHKRAIHLLWRTLLFHWGVRSPSPSASLYKSFSQYNLSTIYYSQ